MDSYYSNLLEQMHVKIGGTPYTIDFPAEEVNIFKTANYVHWNR